MDPLSAATDCPMGANRRPVRATPSTTSRPIRKMIPIAPPKSLNIPESLLRAATALIATALGTKDTVEDALVEYQLDRKPRVERFQEAARQSAGRVVRPGTLQVTRLANGAPACKQTVKAVFPASE